MELKNSPQYFKIYTSEQVKKMKAPSWRVQSVFPAQGLAAIYGPSGVGKSFLAMDLAIAIANGSSWFGRKIKPANVLYCSLEGFHGYANRLLAWENAHNSQVPDNLSFFGGQIDLSDDGSPEKISDISFLMDVVQENSVLFIDTLNQASPFMDENRSSDMGNIISRLRRIEMAKKCLIVLVHHSGKIDERGLRGHSSLIAALDSSIEVKSIPSPADSKMWTLKKSKDSASNCCGIFTLSKTTLDFKDEFEEHYSSCTIKDPVFYLSDAGLIAEKGEKKLKGKYQPLALKHLKQLIRSKGEKGANGVPENETSVQYSDYYQSLSELIQKEHSLSSSKSKEEARQAILRLTEYEFVSGYPLTEGKKYLPESQIWLVKA